MTIIDTGSNTYSPKWKGFHYDKASVYDQITTGCGETSFCNNSTDFSILLTQTFARDTIFTQTRIFAILLSFLKTIASSIFSLNICLSRSLLYRRISMHILFSKIMLCIRFAITNCLLVLRNRTVLDQAVKIGSS